MRGWPPPPAETPIAPSGAGTRPRTTPRRPRQRSPAWRRVVRARYIGDSGKHGSRRCAAMSPIASAEIESQVVIEPNKNIGWASRDRQRGDDGADGGAEALRHHRSSDDEAGGDRHLQERARSQNRRSGDMQLSPIAVMAGLFPAIHASRCPPTRRKWMPGTGSGTTYRGESSILSSHPRDLRSPPAEPW